MRLRNCFIIVCLGSSCSACDRRDRELQGDAPPPLVSARPGICEGPPKAMADAETAKFFPNELAGYCLDPNAEPSAYGRDAARTLDHLCIELLDGECDVYKDFGLERTVALRYVDGAGSPAAVAVTLSRFMGSEGALGFFSLRVVGDGDPLRVAPRPLAAGTLAALGSGSAYVWVGPYVIELSHTNELESPAELRASAGRILPELGRAIARNIGAPSTLPRAIELLPSRERVPSGLRYLIRDVLDVRGTGPAALGYYQRGSMRYRVLAFARADEEAAQDLVGTFGKARGQRKWRDAPSGLTSPFVFEWLVNGVSSEWLFARSGSNLFAVGDEPLVLTLQLGNQERQRLLLTRAEKTRELQRLVESN